MADLVLTVTLGSATFQTSRASSVHAPKFLMVTNDYRNETFLCILCNLYFIRKMVCVIKPICVVVYP